MNLSSSLGVFEILKPKFNPDSEEIWGVYLNSNLDLISLFLLHRGTVNFCLFHPRDLFREAIRCNSAFIILAHNHPSKQVLPSDMDIKMTKKVIKMGLFLEMPVLDHLIFSDASYFSFKDRKLL